ncbi:MAG: TrbG/VirB9 family P-type conjugative transfer protein [Rubrivivax sp.]|nr:TrbG/VirB9 family P-type conjugative transfer protein [Rubrivivax sp.]
MRSVAVIAAGVMAWVPATDALAQAPDPRLREVVYDPQAIVTVPVRRGVVTHLVLGADEAITELGSGLGADCSKPEAPWCIAAQPGGRHIFVKPKSSAGAPNNLAVVTDRRTHAFRLVVLPDGDTKPAVYRLVVRTPVQRAAAAALVRPAVPVLPPPVMAIPEPPQAPSAQALVAERLKASPQLLNAEYLIAEGSASADIVPTLIFDDGRFTYLRFPGNREVPAVFQVLGDGSEAVVNVRMEDDLLVVDRVARHLMLRAGTAVVGVWNEAFDIDGAPPVDATTVPGVRRTVRAQASASARSSTQPGAERSHE